MKRGFTVLELLVASLLLSMLVTMLTMMFNQSSIAWRAGVESVSQMQDTREQMGEYHDITDDALPGLAQRNVKSLNDTSRKIEYRTISIFRNWSGGQLNKNEPSRQYSGRLVDRIQARSLSFNLSANDAMRGASRSVSQPTDAAKKGDYIVGVRSKGPDRQWNTEDDINTFPEEID